MKDILEAISLCAFVAVLFCLYLVATPDQMSAEAELFAHECEVQGK